MSIQMLIQLTPAESSIPVIIKRMKEFNEHNKKQNGYSISIPTDQSSSRNVYPEHYHKPPNVDLG